MSTSTVASQIRAARKTAGLSRRRFGALIKVSRETVWKWESGTHAPSLKNLAKIARALGGEYSRASLSLPTGVGSKPHQPRVKPTERAS